MKFLLTAFIVTVFSAAAFAQSNALPSLTEKKPVKILTSEEANRLNGTAEPTINGIPYSEYKAQQQSLAAKQATTVSTGIFVQQVPVTADPALQRNNEPMQYGILKKPAAIPPPNPQ